MDYPTLIPICFDCRRRIGVEPDVGWTCQAFPDGVPVEILVSKADHHFPFEGDGGLQFEAISASFDEWKESDHPRSSNGQFGSGGSSAPKHDLPPLRFLKGSEAPESLNGIAIAKWKPSKDWNNVPGQKPLDEPKMDSRGLKSSSGVVISEPDGRIWLVRPTDGFGGYRYTFPKGGISKNLNPQANAIKEAYEESGLKADIQDFIGDYEGDTTNTRFYHATRSGGDPREHGWESEAVVLVTPDQAKHLLNRSRDRKILADFVKYTESKTGQDMKMATDPPVSESQRRAMFAARAGHSTLGIPESVGKEFANADPGGKLPAHVGKDMKPEEFSLLRRLLNKFFGEEAKETEHQCANDVPADFVKSLHPRGEGGKFVVKSHNANDEDEERPWDRNGKAASVVFTTPDGRVLLIRRSPLDDHRPGEWCLPGGKADEGEDFEDCARREATEEIGDCSLDGMEELDRARTPNDWEHVTYVVPVKESFKPKLSEEHDDYVWAPVTDLPEKTHPGFRKTVDGIIEDSSKSNSKPVQDRQAFDESTVWEDIAAIVSVALAHDETPWNIAIDEANVRTTDDVGRMHVTDSILTKAVVSPYLGSEINGVMDGEPGWTPLEPDKKYMLLRDPKELEKSVDTFNGLPLLWKHKAATADDHPTDLVIGSTGSSAKFDGTDLKNSLAIWPKYATQAVKDGSRKALSCGYGYKAHMTPGEYNGQMYDGRMYDILGNHVALVDQPRVVGAKVGGDSLPDDPWEKIAAALLAVG